MTLITRQVGERFRSSLKSAGLHAASTEARGEIDCELVECDPSSEYSPKFYQDGTVELYFRGFGYQASLPKEHLQFSRLGLRPPSRSGTPISLLEAKSDFNELQAYLVLPTDVTIVIGSYGRAMAAGPDARRILQEVRDLQRGSVEPMAISSTGLLSPGLRGEFSPDRRK